jgi:dethiobiotin synthetase
MWLLNWLPNFVFHLILVAGVILTVISFTFLNLPVVNKYQLPLKIISILILVAGVWFNGALVRDKDYAIKIANLEKQLAEAQRDSAILNSKVETVFVDKVQKVRDVQVVVQERIRDVAVNIDEQCKITVETVDILNQAAKNPNRK